MPMVDTPLRVDLPHNRSLSKSLARRVERAIANGEIRMELKSGGEIPADKLKPACFTLDKRKYRLRLSDETEESVKVWIEPK